ncbi:uncharacterized protein WCC33_014250 [Rhinophrynus dorsalis]
MNLRRLQPVIKKLRRSKPDSYRSSSNEESSDEDWVPSHDEESDSDNPLPKKGKSSHTEQTDIPATSSILVDANGDPLFDPDGIKHPRSSDWTPRPHVAKYLEAWVRKPISRATRSKLRAECPRPVIPNKVCDTPELDSKMVQFIAKSGRDPRKGVDHALKSCQDKLLDILGPLTKIFELSEEALQSKSNVDTQVLREWVQRAICLLGNANSAIASERRRALLLRIDPKLADMANSEPGPSARGQLFGDTFIKDLGKFVSSFTALDKAQSSLRKVFRPKQIFDKAGRGRGRSPGRARQRHNQFQAPNFSSYRGQPLQEQRNQNPFFPTRGRPWRARPGRGQFKSRPYVVQGFQIEFYSPPYQQLIPPPLRFSRMDEILVDAEISTLKRKGAITQANGDPNGFISNIFLLLKPVIAFLRSRGIRLIIYLDDMLFMSQDPTVLIEHAACAIRLLSNLGFLINWEKSQLIPTQELEFLGFMVNSRDASLSLPRTKIRSIRREIRYVLRQNQISLRLLARILGLLAASIQAIFPGPLHYRALQRLKARHLRNGFGYADLVALSTDAREELLWWLKHLDAWNGRAIFGVMPDLVIESDASLLGWGARLGDLSTGGKWSSEEASLHINCLELLAGSFALKSLTKDRVHCCVLLKMDNVSAVRYINRLGGTKSKPLEELAKDFWHFCLDRNITVVAEHLPGLSNAVADWNSRYLTDFSDWTLHSSVFQALDHIWGPFHIDLFASRLNCRIPQFFSWRPDPDALATDAFLQSWLPGTNYAFPPFAIISRTLLTIRRQAATVVVVTPLWPMQPWFPPLLELSADFPRLLPIFPNLLSDPNGAPHELIISRELQLIAWFLSGIPQVVRDFQCRLKLYWPNHGPRVPEPCMDQHGPPGVVGHVPVQGIPVGQLSVVCRLMRGIRFSRPPQSRYLSLWNVNDVLQFLEAWPPNHDLSLKQLSAKLTMLLCLISFKRVSDVRALDFHSRSFTPLGVQIRVSRRTKTAVRVVSYPAFPSQQQLCVVLCLKEYELRTASFRSPTQSQLLLSFRHPHLPVSSATLARWIRWVMQLAGIDVSLFGAHSTRGAMASKTISLGGRLEDILRAADWSRESTFREFYFKPIDHVTHSVVTSI